MSNYQILGIPDDAPIGGGLSSQHQALLLAQQSLLMTAHRAIVHDVQSRDGVFLPFGIGVSASGELSTVFVEHNPLFPEGKKILIGEDQSSFGLNTIGLEKAIGYIILTLQNEAHLGHIVAAVTCAPNPAPPTNDDQPRMIHLCLEDLQKTALHCFGTYHRLAGGLGWEFSNLGGKTTEPTIFREPAQDFNSLLA